MYHLSHKHKQNFKYIMKLFTKISILIAVLLVAAVFNCRAQESTKVVQTMQELMQKYDGIDGINCLTLVKGGGLEMMKMMLNKEFGKSFMKGVTSITVIEYSDASIEVCNSLHKDLDVFTSMLEEFNVSEEESFSDNDFIRCFASSADSTADTAVISDFVIAMEAEKSKMLLYMAGKIVVD